MTHRERCPSPLPAHPTKDPGRFGRPQPNPLPNLQGRSHSPSRCLAILVHMASLSASSPCGTRPSTKLANFSAKPLASCTRRQLRALFCSSAAEVSPFRVAATYEENPVARYFRPQRLRISPMKLVLSPKRSGLGLRSRPRRMLFNPLQDCKTSRDVAQGT